jgi:Domain of unknown function (DUF6916)
LKRRDLLRHLENHGCQMLREGGNHTIYANAGVPFVFANLMLQAAGQYIDVKSAPRLERSSRFGARESRVKNSVEHLTVDAFQPRVGDRFCFRLRPDDAIDAELIEARPLVDPGNPPAGKSQRRTPFSLLFRTSRTTVLPQRIYEVEHDEMGSYDIFLVPVGPDAVGMVYEAIFT